MSLGKTYLKPNSIKEALDFAKSNLEGHQYLAGGTDVMVNLSQGNTNSVCLIDIAQIEELKKVTVDDGYLKIGTLVTLDEIRLIKPVQDEFAILIEAANSVGSPLIRKSATIGGNILCENRCLYYNQQEWWREAVGYCLKCDGDICIASGGKNACFSEAVSDTAPALISVGARVEVHGFNGQSVIDLYDIYSGDGIKPINLERGAIISSIHLPLGQGIKSVFKKLRQRESLEFTSLTSAVSIDRKGQLCICLSGVDPKPVKINGNRESDPELLVKAALKQSRAIDNEMQSRKYRRKMVKVFIEKSLEELGWSV